MNYTPGIIAVLPLFYIGWSDSVLSPSEMKTIQKHIKSMEFLTKEEQETLINWTDQKNPPSEETFKSWLQAIREYSTDKTIQEKVSLVDLGLQMARKSSGAKAEIWDAPKVKGSIEKLEDALGVSHQLSKIAFYQSLEPEANMEVAEEPAFDAKQMQAILDGKHAELKGRVKKLIMDSFFTISKDVRDKEEYRNLVLEQTKAIARQGFGAYAYPKAYGGQDMPEASTLIFETLALGNLSTLVKYGVQFGLFGGAILQLGTKKHHDKYLKATGSLELPGCFAMTETGHGSNVRNLETTATYDHSDKTITIKSPTLASGKEYIGNAMHSKMAAVFAQLIVNGENHGIHSILVPLRDEEHHTLPGVTVKDNGYKMGLNGVDNGRIWFDQVKVPVENLLDKYGGIDENGNYHSSIKKESKRFFTMLGALVGGRVSVALGSNTSAKKSLDIAIRYALKRRQFPTLNEEQETLIMDYPTHQWRLFPLLAKTYGLNFALDSLREKFGEAYGGTDMREVETLAAGLKSYASWHATDTIQECREACGGKGYLAENEFADLKADTDIFTTFEGDNHVLLQLVAKALLTELKQEFNDGGFMAVARHVMKRVSNSVSVMNPINTRNANAEHLLSTDFMQSAFDYRNQKLLFSLSDRMRSFIGKKLAPSEIFVRTQTHMISLAKAYVESYIFNEFRAKVESLTDSKEKQTLTLLLQLLGLHSIYEDKGWFLENDFLSGEKSKAIRKVLSKQMRKIRPQALLLVEAFDIPEVLRSAQIATFEA
ncbi:acyl-CoA dehydrogenase family protein [Jiulongibacter sp. NS-SX5]|uniref:acyl-CoA dehydrogenase family protein n=1 Tax=Jiulongibacter sp. NS-SX5 TaxID=3463854 RepID=UPI004058E550